MIDKNVNVKSKINIDDNSKVVYASSFGVGGNNEELRLIVINDKLVNNGDDVELINESDLQIVMNYNTAIKLNQLLNKYISQNKWFGYCFSSWKIKTKDFYIIIEIDDFEMIKVITAYSFNKARREREIERV